MSLIGTALTFGTSCKPREVEYDAITGAYPLNNTSIADKFEGGRIGPSCPYPRTNSGNYEGRESAHYNNNNSEILILRR